MPSVVKCMDEYCLTREDWDSMIEINQFPGQPDVVSKIAAKVSVSNRPLTVYGTLLDHVHICIVSTVSYNI